MPFKDIEARRAYQRERYAAKNPTSKPIGRPRAIEGEQMVVAYELLASSMRPKDGGVYFLPVDEIVARQGWKTYKDMRHDDQVKACLAFKKILIAGRTWEMQPGDDTPEAKKAAEFVEWCLKEIDFKSVMREALSALEFGYSMGELVWERKIWDYKPKKAPVAAKKEETPPSNSQYADEPVASTMQVVCLKKIAHRDPQTLELKMDNHGNVQGVRQTGIGIDIELGPEKMWLYSHNTTFGDPYGMSDLRSAYRPWWAKKFIIQFWNVFLERMGSPMTKVTYPLGASEQLKNTLKTILSNLSSKTEILVPEGVNIDLIEATRSGNATYNEALEFHDKAISRALLMVSLLGTGGENSKTQGSQSQSSIHLRILFKMADEITQAVTKSFMDQVVKQLLAYNFPEGTPCPNFMWQDYGQFEGMKIADTVRLLHAAGMLDLDQEDINYCRSVLGLPLRLEGQKEDEVRRPMAPPPPGNANAPPPKAGAGNERAKKGGDTSTTTKE